MLEVRDGLGAWGAEAKFKLIAVGSWFSQPSSSYNMEEIPVD